MIPERHVSKFWMLRRAGIHAAKCTRTRSPGKHPPTGTASLLCSLPCTGAPAPTRPGLWPGLSTGSLCLMPRIEVTLRAGAGGTTPTHPLTRKLPYESQLASLPTKPLWPLEGRPGHQPQLPLQMMPVMVPEEEEDGKPHPIPSHTRKPSISPISSERRDTSHASGSAGCPGR